MAKIKPDQMPIESQFMTDLWNFRKNFYNGEDNEHYWELVVGAAEVLAEKYNRNTYFCDVITSCVGDIERRWKQGKTK